MQIYIKRSKNRTASGVFLLSLILLPPHQPSRARNRQKDAPRGRKAQKSARNRGNRALFGVGSESRHLLSELDTVTEAWHYGYEGDLAPFAGAVIVDDRERVVVVQDVVLILQGIQLERIRGPCLGLTHRSG